MTASVKLVSFDLVVDLMRVNLLVRGLVRCHDKRRKQRVGLRVHSVLLVKALAALEGRWL